MSAIQAFQQFIQPFRKQAVATLDPDASTVEIEIDGMDWHFSELARLITDLERLDDQSARASAAKMARFRLDKLLNNAYRAKEIARGQRVVKQN
jgi:hypothetical protein